MEQLQRSSHLAWPGISALGQLWFRRRTLHVPIPVHRLFPTLPKKKCWQYGVVLLELYKDWPIKLDVGINRRTFVNFGQFKFQLCKYCFDVWTGPKSHFFVYNIGSRVKKYTVFHSLVLYVQAMWFINF